MLVRTLRPHFNGLGASYAKAVGDEYDHPSPSGLIGQGFVELADGASV